MNNVLVTGANGFIGSEVLIQLSQQKCKIFAIIKNEDEKIDHIRTLPGVQIVFCDMETIDKLPELIAERDFACCLHLAWTGSTGGDRSDYFIQFSNVVYSSKLIEALDKLNCKRFFGAGTLAEMDVLNYTPTDGATPNPVSIYGVSKIAAHYTTKALCTKYKISHIWGYLSNTYGIGNFTDNFINYASRLMLSGKRADFTEATQTYDFVYVSDIVKGIILAAEKGQSNNAYYIGSTYPRMLKKFIAIIRDTIDPSIELNFGAIPFNGNCLPPEIYDCTKLIKDTGYKPEINFEDGIRKTVEWLKEQGL